jgi:hypothetical protein
MKSIDVVIFTGLDVLTAVVMNRFIFWDITPCFVLAYYSTCSSTVKMEATWSSETLDDFQRTTRSYILKDRSLQHGGQAKYFFHFRCDGDEY